MVSISTIYANDISKRKYTTKKTTQAPKIDGLLDSDIWNQVEWSGDFVQNTPNDGDAPSQKTAFKILYDDNNLYVFIKAYDTEPDKISRLMARRDNFPGDMVEINIDSDLDKQTAFSFSASASGVIGDEAISQNGSNWDSSWNPIWYMKTSVDAEGWNAEMRIPLSQLRFGNKENHIWGIQVMRHIFRKEERSKWQEIPRDSPGSVHLFGELHGIKDIKPKRQFEITPYTLAKIDRFEPETGNPYADGTKSFFTAGLDGKIGITNDFTLDFTINPDFGQVEADPSEVNLSAFESYFSEKRPFFIEGKSIFDYRPSSGFVISNFNRDNLFYSRRIGRSPQYYPSLEEDEYADVPDATTILGAFKFSGKNKNGLSIGILETVTAEESAKVSYMGTEREVIVEPLTNYFVARVKKDFNKGETNIGGMLTAVNRDLSTPELFFLPTAAYTGGIDLKHYWKERTYYISLNADMSHIIGDEEAISNLQTSSSRYYQRPDASHLSLDETRTQLTGSAASLRTGKTGSGKWMYESSLTYRSPGFEINDIGYMQSTDAIHHGTWVGYYIRKPFWILEKFFLNNNYWTAVNFEGKLLYFSENINFNAKFKNKWNLNGSFTHSSKEYSVSALRGGPALILPGSWNYNININGDNRKKISPFFGFYIGDGNLNSSLTTSFWTGLNYKPIDALSVSLFADYTCNERELQYISVEEMDEDPRYILGSIDQKTLSLTLRLDYNITPNLTIQYFGSPFTSAGTYDNLKYITDSKAEDYFDRYRVFSNSQLSYNSSEEIYSIDENMDGTVDYTVDQPNFNFSQFKSNLVIRWEYMPGSALYLVWSQGRTYSNSMGDFQFDRNINDLFGVYPHDIFLIKFSYRIAM